MKITLAATLLWLVAGTATATCPSYPEIGAVAFSYSDRTAVDAIPAGATLEEAYCAQGIFAATVGRQKGVQAGYRADYTNLHQQRSIGAEGPLRGILFNDMFLHDGVRVPIGYAAVPRITVDLIAVAADDELQRARTPLELLRHIAYFLPVVDLSDAMLAAGHDLTARDIVAVNLGTRFAVIGQPIPAEPTEDFIERLGRIDVTLADGDGRVLGRGRTSDLGGHPLNVLAWLARELEFNAQRIQAGDRLELGAMFEAVAPNAGESLTADYVGPEIDLRVSVRFTRTLERDQADLEILEPQPLPEFLRTLTDKD
jgi:2-keto-4-pentenoate hydratase